MLDAHVHFWNFDPTRDSWITQEMDCIRRDFLPEDAKSVFSANGVEGCIAVQADQSDAETSFLLELADHYPMIMGVVGWIDLKDPDLAQKLYDLSEKTKLKGFRHIVQAEPEGFLLRDEVLTGIETLGKYNYTYDLLIVPAMLADAIRLSERLPSQLFVVDHCAKPNLRTRDIDDWEKGIKILSQNKNIYCKLSGLFTESVWYDWDEAMIFSCLDVIVENFGVDRIMYASDWPVVQLGGSYVQWLNLIKKYTQQFSAHEQQQLFSENAKRFYSI